MGRHTWPCIGPSPPIWNMSHDMTSVCFLMSCTTAMSHTQLPHLAQEYRRSPHGSTTLTHMMPI